MKHIKKYENITEKFDLKIGDYVICEEQTINDKELKNFINNTIGVFIGINGKPNEDFLTLYSIKYDDIPDGQVNGTNFVYDSKGKFYTRNFYKREIKHISKDRKKLEIILDTKKYNI